jgi:HEPN domain-containing protein
MQNRIDLVKGQLRKSESDLKNANLCLRAGDALDTACFHSQQAAERVLKAFLTFMDVDYPHIHNLEKLLEMCAQYDEKFVALKPLGQKLTPYAVELRYDDQFWPAIETVRAAISAAETICTFVLERLPEELRKP